MLTPEQVKFYRQRGYLAVENVIPKKLLGDLRRVTDEFVDKSCSVETHTDVFDLEPSHTAEEPHVRRIKSPANHHSVYDQAMRHPNILNLVSQLIGSGIRQNGHKLNMKNPRSGSPVQWHQDWAFYPHTNDDLLAVGIALDDMRIENSCMMVIPGSHTGPVYDHHQDGVFVGAITETDFTPQGAVPVEVNAGGISLHHVRTLHGSSSNTSSKPRRLFLIQYCAIDAWPILGITEWKQFNECILQGQLTYQPRMIDLPIRIPRPYGEKEGSIYEVQSLLEDPLFQQKRKTHYRQSEILE